MKKILFSLIIALSFLKINSASKIIFENRAKYPVIIEAKPSGALKQVVIEPYETITIEINDDITKISARYKNSLSYDSIDIKPYLKTEKTYTVPIIMGRYYGVKFAQDEKIREGLLTEVVPFEDEEFDKETDKKPYKPFAPYEHEYATKSEDLLELQKQMKQNENIIKKFEQGKGRKRSLFN